MIRGMAMKFTDVDLQLTGWGHFWSTPLQQLCS